MKNIGSSRETRRKGALTQGAKEGPGPRGGCKGGWGHK